MLWKNSLFVTCGSVLLLSLATADAAHAQNAETRIERLEKEMRAVQRKVFPGGDTRFFEPEITAAPPSNGASANVQGGGISADMLARLDSLESTLQRLTGRIEEQELEINDMQAQLAALNGGGRVGGTGTTAPAAVATPANRPTATAPVAAVPDPSRVAAVAAIEKPSTGNAGEDQYSYGFRLWDAGFYPEARMALEEFIKDHSGHARMSHARNLLGRAWLDDGKPASSVEIFLGNYQTDPKGARAPDSLLFLSEAMTKLGQADKACVVLAELADVYPDAAGGRLSGDLATRRAQAKCN